MLFKLNIKNKPNEIGEVKNIEPIEAKIQALSAAWDEQSKEMPKASWWKKVISGANISAVTTFLMGAVDELIQTVEEFVDYGPDKKATVLNGIDRLYEYVIKEALPIWLKPFASQVKQYVIYVLISNAIDWMVGKYRDGNWKPEVVEEVVEVKDSSKDFDFYKSLKVTELKDLLKKAGKKVSGTKDVLINRLIG